MNPQFTEAVKKARQEGNDERRREYLESCDRGAKEIEQLFQSEYHLKEALERARRGHNIYCTPAGNAVRICMASKDHRECNDAKKKVFLESERNCYGECYMLCYNLPK